MRLKRYKKDIAELILSGDRLSLALFIECLKDEDRKKKLQKKYKNLPNFRSGYQAWYSEAISIISQLLPDRSEDFKAYYKPLRARKEVTYENYTISDNLKGLAVSRNFEEKLIVGPSAAINSFEQQLNIVKALEKRFESLLFDIQTLVQADLLENELESAEELNRKGFFRGAGAIAGVVLEGHLRKVCEQHKISLRRNSSLGTINDKLKEGGALDIQTWRFVQHLIDLRNLCDHKKAKEPTKEDIDELIAGARKVTKTVF